MPALPVVSIVTCFLNGAAWIGEAIESILHQDFPHWELILIDDGSLDGATDIALGYVSRHPGKLKYREHPGHQNRGLTISRNVGAAAASGKFLAFLDADDAWAPGKLSGDLELFAAHPEATMICHASMFWYSWENDSKTDVYTPVGAAPDKLYPPGTLFFDLYPLGTGAPPCPSGIMIRQEAFHRRGGFEEVFHGIYGLYEDQALLAKIYFHERVYVSGKADNRYRKRAGSMTDSLNDLRLYRTVRLFFLRWLNDYFRTQATLSPDLQALLDRRTEELLQAMEA